MMMQKRMTGRLEGDFVVFLIGMRVNRWWKLWTLAARGAGHAAHDQGARGQARARLSRRRAVVRTHDDHGAVLALEGAAPGIRQAARLGAPAGVARASISSSAPTATWASGTRPTACTRATTRTSTST